MVAPVVDAATCFSLPSVADSSPLLYEPSALVALASAMGRGRSEVCPRDSAIALWSFYTSRLVLVQQRNRSDAESDVLFYAQASR
jgi:hypothetical protein